MSKLRVKGQRPSSFDNGLLVLLSKNFFLWIHCPKISLLLFKDDADLMIDCFSCKQSLYTSSLGANVFTFLTTSHLMLKLLFLFFNFQTCSLSVVEVLLCSNLKDDLCKLNLVLNSFSVICFLVVRSCFCYCCFIYNAFSEALAVKWARVFFCRQ